MEAIAISREVLDGIEAVRDSGITNMLDVYTVAEIAEGMGYEVTARYIEENRTDYFQGVIEGFDVVDES